MMFVYIIFAVSVAYAVIGNAVVYICLSRRKIHFRSIWAGTPGYLYRRCVASPAVGAGLCRFALSTNVSFVVACFASIPLIGLANVH